ncbi:MAG: hypothetical protein AMS23_08710 [Bacteroides sp. SM1_62]|nr:MAG: hypothetical protein AMS23_08710 [Bacteroides sp. SM1_62]
MQRNMNSITTIKTSIIILAISLSLWNCTERIDIELDSTYTRLVVEGYVTSDTAAHWIRLSETSDYFHNQAAPAVTGAEVAIDDGESVHMLTESDTLPGWYLTSPDYHGIPGRTYTLRIRNVDIDKDGMGEEYTAASAMRPVNTIDSIQIEWFDTFVSGYQVRVWAWDSPDPDWYAFKVWKNGVLVTDTLYELIVQNDEFFNGNYTYGIPSQFLSTDKPEEVVEVGDTITFEINGITEEYYNYVIEAQSQVFPQTPLFSGPPANIRTTFDNDAIGFFTAYSVNYSSTIATADIVNGGKP